MAVFKASLLLGAACLLALVAGPQPAAGDCCYAYECGKTYFGKALCEDCSRAQSIYCGKPGGGGCNMFGCNCGGGCIERPAGEEPCNDIKRCMAGEYGRKARDVEGLVSQHDLVASVSNGSDVIKMADKDGDGRLDEVEVRAFFTFLGVPVMEAAWRTLDRDQDGKLDELEIDFY